MSSFTLVNPIGMMPVFMSMTTDLEQEVRKRTARKAVIVATLTLIGFAFTGQFIFWFFGISVHSFRIAGGIILLYIGFDMLQARITHTKIKEDEIKKYVTDISVTPLAIPMLAGPGSISNAIIMMDGAKGTAETIVLLVSFIGVGISSFLILWSSTKVSKVLGETGNKVLMRLMGLIVMVIAVEFLLSGLKPVMIDVLKSVK